MIEIGNKILQLAMKEDGTQVALTDLARGCAWELDASRLGFRRTGAEEMPAVLKNGKKLTLPLELFTGGKAARRGDAIEVEYRFTDGSVRPEQKAAMDALYGCPPNVSDAPVETGVVGLLPPNSWKEVRPG